MGRFISKISILLFFSLLVGCKAKQAIMPKQAAQESSLSKLVSKVLVNQSNFESANISKMHIDLSVGGRDLSVSSSCKMIKDSLIHLSIQPFAGVEMLKAEFSNTEIRVFDKFNSNYYVMSYLDLSRALGVIVNLRTVQNIISARFFCVGSDSINLNKLILDKGPQNFDRIVFKNADFVQYTCLNANAQVANLTISNPLQKSDVIVDYANYIMEAGISYPKDILIKFVGQGMSGLAKFSISKVQFNSPMNVSFLDPTRYNKADIRSLLTK